MSEQTEKQPKTFRYKFTNNFLGNLTEFSRLHRFDDAAAFKDNWKIWCDNNKDIIKTMEDWWIELKYGSKRDQLSFPYVAWKNNLDFNFINEDIDNNQWVRMMKKWRDERK